MGTDKNIKLHIVTDIKRTSMLNVVIWCCLFIHCCSKPIRDDKHGEYYNSVSSNGNGKCNDCTNTIDASIKETNELRLKRDEIRLDKDITRDCADGKGCRLTKRDCSTPSTNDLLHCTPSDTHNPINIPSLQLPKEFTSS